MKIITQLVILTLSMLLVNVHDDDQYCTKLIEDFNAKNCTTTMVTISNCCDFKNILASGVFKLNKGSFDNSVDVYCDMTTDKGGSSVDCHTEKQS